jgi:hypothetical protein
VLNEWPSSGARIASLNVWVWANSTFFFPTSLPPCDAVTQFFDPIVCAPFERPHHACHKKRTSVTFVTFGHRRHKNRAIRFVSNAINAGSMQA